MCAAAAVAKVEAHASRPQRPYSNPDGERVTWRLAAIVDVRPVVGDAAGDDIIDTAVRHFRDLAAYQAFAASEVSWRKGDGG